MLLVLVPVRLLRWCCLGCDDLYRSCRYSYDDVVYAASLHDDEVAPRTKTMRWPGLCRFCTGLYVQPAAVLVASANFAAEVGANLDDDSFDCCDGFLLLPVLTRTGTVRVPVHGTCAMR